MSLHIHNAIILDQLAISIFITVLILREIYHNGSTANHVLILLACVLLAGNAIIQPDSVALVITASVIFIGSVIKSIMDGTWNPKIRT